LEEEAEPEEAAGEGELLRVPRNLGISHLTAFLDGSASSFFSVELISVNSFAATKSSSSREASQVTSPIGVLSASLSRRDWELEWLGAEDTTEKVDALGLLAFLDRWDPERARRW
jgi:hypothetical protein